MINRVILIGRLTRDPELRYTANGIGVCTFSIAVNRPYTNQAGERPVDFIDIVAWRQLAETVATYMTKGRLVAVEGRLQPEPMKTRRARNEKQLRCLLIPLDFWTELPAPEGPSELREVTTGIRWAGTSIPVEWIRQKMMTYRSKEV